MADNEYKREIVNDAITILREGKTSVAGQFHTSIDDSVFNDYSTGSTEGVKRVCREYPLALKEALRDIKPEFAIQYADLGAEIRIDKEINGWDLLFEFPDDYLDMVAQVSEGGRTIKPGQSAREPTHDHKVFTFDSYAHVVLGTDSQAWKCIVAHTAAAANRPVTGADYATYWELYDVAGSLGATWRSGWSYKASQDGRLLATNTKSNSPSATVDDSIESAYIKYIPFVQAGINDKPQFYTEEFRTAFAVKLAGRITKDEIKQFNMLRRYKLYDKPAVLRIQNMDRHKKKHVTVLEARTR